MKSMKIATVVLFTFLSTIVFAGGNCESRIKNKDIFTPEQIQMRISHCETMKEPREAFKATLTDEQKAIRKDKTLSKKDKKAKLAATLSPEQKEMKDAMKAKKKELRKAFKATLTKEQKQTLKERRKANKN